MGQVSSILLHTHHAENRYYWRFESPVGPVEVALPCMAFWANSLVLLGVQSVFNLLVSVVTYYTIVRHRGSSQSFLVGYGVVCPALLFLPFIVLRNADFESSIFIVCLVGAVPAILLMRVMEAMHGIDMPKAATESLSGCLVFFTGTINFTRDPNTGGFARMSRAACWQKCKSFIVLFAQASVLLSLLLPNGQVFGRRDPATGPLCLYHWSHLLDSLLMAGLTSVCLEAGAEGLGLVPALVTGFEAQRFSDSPITKSTSPSDFWGNRWNKPVGGALKRGLFKPLRGAGVHRYAAAIATFFASGVIHEYFLVLMSYRRPHTGQPYRPAYGRHTGFFMWNGALLVLEKLLKDSFMVRQLSRLPRPVRTALVLLAVLPIVHVFTDEYVANGFFQDTALGYFHFRFPISEAAE